MCVACCAMVLGLQVAVLLADGTVGYEPVYAFGHQDASTQAPFVELETITASGDESPSIQVRQPTWGLAEIEHNSMCNTQLVCHIV